MNIRKFIIKDGKAVIDDSGEFFHINDIKLKLLEEQNACKNYLEYISSKNDEWSEKEKYSEKKKIGFIEHLLNEFK